MIRVIPKSDDLLNGKYNRDDVLEELGLIKSENYIVCSFMG